MTIQEFQDYAFCSSATYIGAVGVGKGCLIGTQNLLLGLPEQIHSGVWNSVWTTTYSIEGKTPGEAIQGMAALESVNLQDFERSLVALGDKCDGAVLVNLAEQKRLKLRAGLCTKGVYWSARESGPGWSGYGLGSKELTQKWIQFYANHPLSV